MNITKIEAIVWFVTTLYILVAVLVALGVRDDFREERVPVPMLFGVLLGAIWPATLAVVWALHMLHARQDSVGARNARAGLDKARAETRRR